MVSCFSGRINLLRLIADENDDGYDDDTDGNDNRGD